MSGLQADFEAAVARSKQLAERPSNEQLLRLYALYKQASVGDVDGERPGFSDFVARAKYDAWAGVKGLSCDDAQRAYMELVASLGA